jgi:DNA-binding PucR family transcriptional regulator
MSCADQFSTLCCPRKPTHYGPPMAEGRAKDSPNTARLAAAIVGQLADRLEQITSSIQQILAIEIAELGGDAQLLELQRDTVAANVHTVFSAIRHAIPIEHVEPPTAALEYARRLAQREVSVTALIRGYRLGHEEFLNFLADEIRVSELDPQQSLDVFEHITTIVFRYIDLMSQQVVTTYQHEHDRWLQNRNSLRAQRVREILDGTDIDVDAVSTAIRYPLRVIHVGVVVWYREADSGDEPVLLERFTNQLAQSLRACDSPLFISVDRITGSAWIPLQARDAVNVTARIRTFTASWSDAPWIAIGNPLPGVDGFRRSHWQAQHARAVAITSGSDAHRVTAASDPGLPVAALLGDNVGAARAWIAEVLGSLACDTENDERLRETLRVFLATGSSFKAAAERLHLHANTVKYRVSRAIERRGRPTTDDRLDVEVALLLCHWFGAAVLSR